MTMREYHEAVLNAHISEEMDALAQKSIATMDNRNAKRKGVETKEKKEAAARRAVVLDFLKTHEGAFTREQIAEATEISPSQVSGACTALVQNGLVAKSEVKIDKARKVAYSAI